MNELKLNTSFSDILRFAIPISFSILIPQINYVVNNIFLSRLGELELGTAGITGVYYLVFAVIGFGFNSGLQSLLSRSAGSEKRSDIGRLISQALRMILFTAVLGIAVTYLLAPFVLKSQVSSQEVLQSAIDFIRIRIFGLPFLYAYQVGNSFLISTNNTRFLVIGSVCEAATNILLDYAFIFGHFGFPAMGFNGAAWASVCAEAVGMVVVHSFLWYRRLPQTFRLLAFRRWDWESALRIADRSAPLIFQVLISIISWLLFYLWIEHLGQRALAISNTMRNVFGIFGVAIWALASTSNNMVSNLIGQERLDEVIPLIKKIGTLSILITLPFCLILNLFPGYFFQIYNSSSGFTHDAIPVIRVVSLAILIMSQGAIWLNAISGTGLTRINLGIEILAVVVYVFYVYKVVHFEHYPLIWAWGSEFFYWGILFTFSWIFFNWYPWRLRYKK